MIEKLIADEEIKLKNKLSTILEEYNLLLEKLSSLTNKLEELKKLQENIVLDRRPLKNKFNLFKRIFLNSYNKECERVIYDNQKKRAEIEKFIS